jgi:uncharacterized membrane protein HdeD (DUF308 family)
MSMQVSGTAGVVDDSMLVRLGKSWGLFVFFGVVSLVIGIAALVWPKETLAVIAVLFGIQLIFNGILRLVASLAYHDRSGTARVLMAVLGIFSLLVGIYAAKHVEVTVVVLGLVLGIFWILDGIAQLMAASEFREMPGRPLVIAAGVLSIGFGVALLVWPSITLRVLAVVVGAWLIVYGLLAIMTGMRVKALGS